VWKFLPDGNARRRLASGGGAVAERHQVSLTSGFTQIVCRLGWEPADLDQFGIFQKFKKREDKDAQRVDGA
jgi:hypothetical protein